jgi:hypothetical protein
VHEEVEETDLNASKARGEMVVRLDEEDEEEEEEEEEDDDEEEEEE